jgi:hypothetical protein
VTQNFVTPIVFVFSVVMCDSEFYMTPIVFVFSVVVCDSEIYDNDRICVLCGCV